MRVVDPDRAIDQSREFRITTSRFELRPESITRRPAASRDGGEVRYRSDIAVRVTLTFARLERLVPV
jgi:hypothetical protein